MAIELKLTSPASPEAVLAAIRENTRQWRESLIPRELWERGVLQVVASLKQSAFSIRYDRRWQRSRGGDPLRLNGVVRQGPQGGTIVEARCGMRGPGRVAATIFAITGVFGAVVSGGAGWAWVFFVIAAALVLADEWNDRALNQSNPEAAYLVERLREAVAQASGSALNAPS